MLSSYKLFFLDNSRFDLLLNNWLGVRFMNYSLLEFLLNDGALELFLNDFLMFFMNYGFRNIMNDFFVSLMNNWLVNFSDLLLVDDRLMVFMDDVLMLFMNDIFMVLVNNVLMMLMNYIFVVFLNYRLVNMSLNLDRQNILFYLSWNCVRLEQCFFIVSNHGCYFFVGSLYYWLS